MTNAVRRRLAAPDLSNSEFAVGRTKDRPAGRNANETRLRILDAALGEFAAKGLAGARVDQIAAAAQCNKSLIFVYFESKSTLFTTVVEKQFERISSEVVFTPRNRPAFAGRMFDFAMKNPESMRLLAWYALEYDGDNHADPVWSIFNHQIDLKAVSSGALGVAFPANFLLTAIFALCTAWIPGSPIRQMHSSSEHGLVSDLRKHVVESVGRMMVD